MPAERISIEEFLALSKTCPVIDVRSPGEYNHAHLPGAHSLPLFSDEERKVVGTTYKQKSREAAIKIGLDYFGPKMRAMVEQAEVIVKDHYKERRQAAHDHNGSPDAHYLLVYCWRGGMRSGAVSWLLDMYGFKVYTLVGGYKKFRHLVLDSFKNTYPFRILGGYTGSGKTELLQVLKEKGERIIDLEDLAKHKGSAFGNIGLPPQPSQEMFENLLFMDLSEKGGKGMKTPNSNDPNSPFTIHHSPIWLEDESQRIGHVNIPADMWHTMRRSPLYYLDIPFEERLKHIVAEYGNLDRERMLAAIDRISEKLGGQNAKEAKRLLEEGDIMGSFRILLKYYDKYYAKAMHNREDLAALLHTVTCDTISSENANLLLSASQPQD